MKKTADKGVIEHQNILSWRDPRTSWSPALSEWPILGSNPQPWHYEHTHYHLKSHKTSCLSQIYFWTSFMSWGHKGKFLVSAIWNRRGQNPEGNTVLPLKFAWPHSFPSDPHKEETEQWSHRVVLIVHSWHLQCLIPLEPVFPALAKSKLFC